MKPVAAGQVTLAAQRRQRAVQRFLDEGFPPREAVKLAAMYLATLRKMDDAKKKAAPVPEGQTASATDVALSPIWTPPRGLAPHERVAARLCAWARMSSEKAHQKAAAIARAADAQEASS